MTAPFTAHLDDEAATRAFGARIAQMVGPGLSIHLVGDLGAGKTTLVRGLLQALGFTGKVKSPTYTLVELYTLSSLNFYHFDFYRFRDPQEWHEAGFRDAFAGDAVCLVEWPEKAGDLLPPPDLRIALAVAGTGRDVTVSADTDTGKACIDRLRGQL